MLTYIFIYLYIYNFYKNIYSYSLSLTPLKYLVVKKKNIKYIKYKNKINI